MKYAIVPANKKQLRLLKIYTQISTIIQCIKIITIILIKINKIRQIEKYMLKWTLLLSSIDIYHCSKSCHFRLGLKPY